MKQNVLILLMIFSIGIMNAQKDQRKQNLESQKVAYITMNLNLSPEEAQVFWPIYNKKSDELKALRKLRKENRPGDNFESLSDNEIQKMILKDLELRQEELTIEKKYLDEFKKAISVKQIAKLMRTEDRFKLEIAKKFRDRKEGGPENRPNGTSRPRQ